MTKVVLHIGAHKTGTTSIQRFLDASSSELLAKHGTLYPETGRAPQSPEGQHRLAWCLTGARREPLEDTHWHKLLEEIALKKPSRVIISSEDFEFLSGEGVERLLKYLGGFELEFIYFTRDTFSLLLAKYNQQVKSAKCSLSFHDFAKANMERCDGAHVTATWRQRLGDAAPLTDCSFEEAVASPDGLVGTFLHLAGVSGMKSAARDATRFNVSLGQSHTRTLLLCNRIAARGGFVGRMGKRLHRLARRRNALGRVARLLLRPLLPKGEDHEATKQEILRLLALRSATASGEYQASTASESGIPATA